MTADTCAVCGHSLGWHIRSGVSGTGDCAAVTHDLDGTSDHCLCAAYVGRSENLLTDNAVAAFSARTTWSVDDYEGWAEKAFLPSVKYAVVWDEDRDGWAVLTLDDGGAFS